MTDLELWSAIVGFFLPLGISVVQQRGWNDGFRAVVTFLICMVAAAGTSYFKGDLNLNNWLHSLLVVFVMTIAAFKGLWQKTIAPAVERATSAS